jgi:DNA-directed RNA polymerase specialized sigma24 family protein
MDERDRRSFSFDEEVDALTTPGVLTERQAEAFVHREIELTPRWAAAEDMDIAVSTLDNHVQEAKRRIGGARELVEAVESIRYQAGESPD